MRLKGRRRLRSIALQTLYQLDLMNDWTNTANILNEAFKRENIEKSEDREFLKRLINTVVEHKENIDKIISSYLKGWDIERLNVVERNILRIGVTELLFTGDVPYKVAINEAVELSKVFAAEGAAGLVNGVLDKIAQDKGVKK